MSIPWIEVLGWIGSALFALCALPQAIHSWKQKNSDGLTWPFLMMWMGGEVLTLVYVSTKNDVLPLLVNYYLNGIFLIVIIWFKACPTRSKQHAAS